MSSSIISLKNVSVVLNRTEILHDITLSLTRAEIFGYIGPNGAGKTTTLKTILGILAPTSGNVSIFGRSPTDRQIQRRIGFMPENTYFYKYLTGDEFLDYCAKFYDMDGARLKKRKDDILERVGLTNARGKKLSTYSKGMLQRIGIAQSLIHDPEIVFLDEPMSGLDPIGRKIIKDLIFDLKSAKKTVFFSTHILPDVEALCDRFAIINHGKIIAEESVLGLSGRSLESYFLEKIQENP